LLTDGNGIPLGIEVAGANRHDSRLVEATLKSIPIKRPKVRPYHRQHLCLDAGYVGDEVAALADAFEYTLHVRPRGEEAKTLREQVGFKARRWVVERTHSWLNRFRRILIRWEKSCENYLAMLHLSFALITFGKLFACY
jgi:Transposase DDE domain.